MRRKGISDGKKALQNDSSIMKPTETIDLINYLEEKFPVQTWKFEGFHFWPIIRINAALALQCSDFLPAKKISFLQHMFFKVKTLFKTMHYFSNKRRSTSAGEKFDLVCLSDGISFQKLAGEYWEKFIDPIREMLESENYTSLALDPTTFNFKPNHLPFEKIAPNLLLAKLKVFFKADHIEAQLSNIEGLNDFYGELKDKNLTRYFPTKKKLACEITYIRACAKFFKNLLISAKARLAIQVSYYNQYGYAFNLACRELKIPCIDVQHGVTGAKHPAYGSWKNVPESGFEILPSLFWSWTAEDVKTINDWAQNTGGFHNAFLGEQPLNNFFKTSGAELYRFYSNRIAELANKASKKNVLISLQPVFISEAVMNDLLKIIKDSPQNYQWWVRAHPCNTPDEFAFAKKILLSEHERTIFFEEATEPPLMAVLEKMDLHVTHCSSVVLEALTFNIPSIVIDPFGFDLFSDLIKEGRVFYCPNEKLWREVLKKIPAIRHSVLEKNSAVKNPGYEHLVAMLEKKTKT